MNRSEIPWITPENLALFVDLYELTMAQSYHHRGYNPPVVFDYFVRHLPPERRFLIFAGLEQLIAYLQHLRFHPEALKYLGSLGFRTSFLRYLEGFRFTGDLWSVPEGTVVFAGEVLVRVEAPLIQAQIVETALLNLLNFETLIASKAARVVLAAKGRGVVDFSPRRDHGLDAANKVARASFLVGAMGTSNVLAGKLWGIPVFGTMAHSYVMAFPDERTAFRAFCEDYPDRPVLLVDTYDVTQGIQHAIEVGKELQKRGKRLFGIRIDSGDLVYWSRKAREMLRNAGMGHVRILLSGDLNEYKIRDLLEAGAEVDSFGVGTEMGTSRDVPALGGVYKLVQVGDQPVVKRSAGKQTLPGRKQVYRFPDRDVVALEEENLSEGTPLLRPVLMKGQVVDPLPSLEALRDRTLAVLHRLPERLRRVEPVEKEDERWPVHLSPGLRSLMEKLHATVPEDAR